MFSIDPRSPRPGRRARRRTALPAPERLESRELLAYNPLGFSLPDLSITGSAGNHAAWGGSLGVIATVINQGSSTVPDPLAQSPGSFSTAAAAPSTVSVIITPRPSLRHPVTIGTFQAPALAQNSIEQIAETFTLPARPAGFPVGGKFYVHLAVNSTGSILDANRANNVSRPIPVHLAGQVLPDVVAADLSLPSSLRPGDTIAPTITVVNAGTAPTSGTVQVALVASTTKHFTIGSSIVALYSITTSIPASSQVGTGGLLAAFSQTQNPLSNSITFTGPPVTLPVSPRTYYLGLVVDPFGHVRQLHPRSTLLQQIRAVGPPIAGLPPAGVISTPNVYPFPIPATGIAVGATPTSSTIF